MSEHISRRDTSPKSDSKRSTTSVHPSRSPSQDSWSSSDSRSSKMSGDELISRRSSPRPSTSKLTRRPGKSTLRKRHRPKSKPESGEEHEIQPSVHSESSGSQHLPLTAIPFIGTEPFTKADPCIIEPPPAHPQLYEPVKPGQTVSPAIPPVPVDIIESTEQLEEQDEIETADEVIIEDPPEQPPPQPPTAAEAVILNQASDTESSSSSIARRRRSCMICMLALALAFGVGGLLMCIFFMICAVIPFCQSLLLNEGEYRRNRGPFD